MNMATTPKPTKKKNYLSRAGYQRIVDERDFLVKEERPKVCDVVAWAASLGDRSENADYQYGKKRLREIDRRVRFLNSRLANFEIVDIAKQTGDTIKFGATVKVMVDDEQERQYVILGPDEVDLDLGRISFLSPIGRALMGKREGDSLEIQTPNGEHEYEVLEISYIEIPMGESSGK
jgi:transcription elongation factor GreB